MKLILLLAFSTLCFACNNHKISKPTPAPTLFFLTLADGYDVKHLKTNYNDQGFIEASRSSRTTNSYRASFNCSDVASLKNKLSSDPVVIEVSTEESAPSNGTNVGHSKSKPEIKHKQ
jgi:hypothetical protein